MHRPDYAPAQSHQRICCKLLTYLNTFELCHEKTVFLHMRKQIDLCSVVTAQLISAFVFASHKVQFLLLPKSKISSL